MGILINWLRQESGSNTSPRPDRESVASAIDQEVGFRADHDCVLGVGGVCDMGNHAGSTLSLSLENSDGEEKDL